MNKKTFLMWEKLSDKKKIEYEKRFTRPLDELSDLLWQVLIATLLFVILIFVSGTAVGLFNTDSEGAILIVGGLKMSMILCLCIFAFSGYIIGKAFIGRQFLKSGGKE